MARSEAHTLQLSLLLLPLTCIVLAFSPALDNSARRASHSNHDIAFSSRCETESQYIT
jgi:hypothetical protein